MTPFHIMLVEDNEGDIFLITEAMESAGFGSKLSVVKDGKAAVDFLTTQMDHRSGGRPDLVLLDINLPKMNGHEVLSSIKTHDNLKQIPVVMLTTSSAESDIMQSYNQHANCFVTKPHEAESFMTVIQKIDDFWRTIASKPSKK